MSDVFFKQFVNKPLSVNEVGAVFDICFVLNVNSRGWILEKICKIIEQSAGKISYYIYSERNDKLSAPLPRARNYFFAHFSLCYFTMQNYPQVWEGNRFVWYTHPDLKKGLTIEGIVSMVDNCTQVFTPCSRNVEDLKAWGARGDNISVPLGGADPEQFKPTPRTGEGAVGFVGAFYDRKQPEKMLELAKLLPHRRFILVGPRAQDIENPGLLWFNWPHFSEFCALPNVEYVEAPYEEFSTWYDKFDVYCSTSALEGGPITVIEAMMANVIPVVSDTGFAQDVIKHGDTGYIFPIDAPSTEIAPLLEKALDDTTTDISKAAQVFSWKNFGDEIWDGIRGTVQLGEQVLLANHDAVARYLIRGFHLPEPRGIWTRAADAEILLPLARDAGKPRQIIMLAWTSEDAGPDGVTVDVAINGTPAGSFTATTASKPHEIDIPEGIQAGENNEYRVSLHQDHLVTHADRPEGSREERTLGIKIGWISSK